MSLDDEIKAAKQKERLASLRQAQDREREARVLAEAVDRLSGVGEERFFTVTHYFSWLPFGYKDARGKNFHVTGEKRCWVIFSMESRHSEGAPMVWAPVLLLEDATWGQFFDDGGFSRTFTDLHTGEYVSARPLEPVEPPHPFFLDGTAQGDRVPMLEKRLAEAIVAYGAA